MAATAKAAAPNARAVRRRVFATGWYQTIYELSLRAGAIRAGRGPKVEVGKRTKAATKRRPPRTARAEVTPHDPSFSSDLAGFVLGQLLEDRPAGLNLEQLVELREMLRQRGI